MIDLWLAARVVGVGLVIAAVVIRRREKRRRQISSRWFRENLRSELTRGWDGPRWKLPAEIDEDKPKRP